MTDLTDDERTWAACYRAIQWGAYVAFTRDAVPSGMATHRSEKVARDVANDPLAVLEILEPGFGRLDSTP